MKYKKTIITVSLLSVMGLGIFSWVQAGYVKVDKDTLLSVDKGTKISSNFNKDYEITYNDPTYDKALVSDIKELTKRATYLLVGNPNTESESSEDYYKRYKDYLELRYAPDIPKDSNSITGYDMNSQEWKDDVVSGISVPGMFTMLKEYDVKYNAYGEIRVGVVDDSIVTSMIQLDNVKMKWEDENDPRKYKEITTRFTIIYQFKKLNGEYKLLYVSAKTDDDMQNAFDNIDETAGELQHGTTGDEELRNIYDFSRADAITDDALNSLYESNKNKLVYINSMYNTGVVASANGFFINKNIILTTYSYIEKSLMKAQAIIINDSQGNTYELEGVVTINVPNDIAVLKVKNESQEYIEPKQVESVKREDGVMSLSSKTGVGLTASKGIIISSEGMMETSIAIPEEAQGSPLFDANGNIIGMLNSKMLNTSMSTVTDLRVIDEYYNKFNSIDMNDITYITFDELKENYYIRYTDENIINTVPDDKLKEYLEVANLQDSIDLELVKASYKDDIVSLRYKNEAAGYISSLELAGKYIETLQSKGYEQTRLSDTKIMLEGKDYNIIIMSEFNYLIIVMVKL